MRFPFPPAEADATSVASHVAQTLADVEQPEDTSSASTGQVSVAADARLDVCKVSSVLAVAEPPVSPVESPSLPEVEENSEPPALTELRLDTEPLPAPLPRPRPQRKVIAFPRQAAHPETLHRLADPVLPEQPRILDVPEELEALPTTPFLDGLQFGSNTQPAVAHADNVELPFRAVGRTHRLFAALLDAAIVAAAAGVFAAVGYKLLPRMTFTKPVALTGAGLLMLLWAIYQYLLLVYGGATAGMRVAKIRLSTFKGATPRVGQRRHRVLALYFSTASVVMGLLWAFVDVDALCWHDRISRTYLTDRQ